MSPLVYSQSSSFQNLCVTTAELLVLSCIPVFSGPNEYSLVYQIFVKRTTPVGEGASRNPDLFEENFP
jgi:hypothetical protein